MVQVTLNLLAMLLSISFVFFSRKKNISLCRYCLLYKESVVNQFVFFFFFQDHIFKLMKSDSYSRYLRSDMYKEFLSGTRKKVRLLPAISNFSAFKHTWHLFDFVYTFVVNIFLLVIHVQYLFWRGSSGKCSKILQSLT